jgi:hypothetical protein
MSLFARVTVSAALVALLFAGCDDGESGERTSDGGDSIGADGSAAEEDDAAKDDQHDGSLGDDAGSDAGMRGSDAGSDSGRALVPALACNQSFTLSSAELPTELLKCTEIVGNLIVQTKLPMANIALPNLQKLSGDLIFEADALRASFSAPLLERVDKSIDFIVGSKPEKLELPLLKSIGGRLYAYGALITELPLPALETITGALDMQSNRLKQLRLPKLTSANEVHISIEDDLVELSLPQLSSVALAVEIVDNERLTSLHLESLTELVSDFSGRLVVKDNPLLGDILVPKLRRISDLEIKHNVVLVSVQLPALQRIDSGLLVDDCLQLEELSLPRLTYARALTMRGNSRLTRVSFLELAGTETLTLSGNAMLQSMSVPGLSAPATRAMCDRMLGAWPCP